MSGWKPAVTLDIIFARWAHAERAELTAAADAYDADMAKDSLEEEKSDDEEEDDAYV